MITVYTVRFYYKHYEYSTFVSEQTHCLWIRQSW